MKVRVLILLPHVLQFVINMTNIGDLKSYTLSVYRK